MKINSIQGIPAYTTTEICNLLGMNISVKFIEEELGIAPDEKTRVSAMWYQSKFPYICYQLSQHIYGVGEDYTREKHNQSATH